MRALAELIMRGRIQAALVAVFGSLLPLVSPAAVALVTLRRGLLEGFGIFLWALLPVLVPMLMIDVAVVEPAGFDKATFNPVDLSGSSNALLYMLHFATVSVVVITLLSAAILRLTVSWQHTVIAAMVFGLIAAYLMELFFTADVLAVVGFIEEQMLLLETQQATQGLEVGSEVISSEAVTHDDVSRASKGMVLAFFALVSTTSALASLLLGRWWQSLLVNPGGFQIEIRQLRLNPVQALLLLVPVIVVLVVEDLSGVWAIVLTVPYLLCTVGLVHWLVNHRKLGVNSLVIFYIVLIVVFPVKLIIAISLLDSLVDFRSRLSSVERKNL